jgi:hypothetical protein
VKNIRNCVGDPNADAENAVLAAEQKAQVRGRDTRSFSRAPSYSESVARSGLRYVVGSVVLEGGAVWPKKMGPWWRNYECCACELVAYLRDRQRRPQVGKQGRW